MVKRRNASDGEPLSDEKSLLVVPTAMWWKPPKIKLDE